MIPRSGWVVMIIGATVAGALRGFGAPHEVAILAGILTTALLVLVVRQIIERRNSDGPR